MHRYRFSSMRGRLGHLIQKLKDVGFYHVFLTSVLVKFVGMAGNILLARVMSKTDYGTYSYILNAYSILILLGDMGTNVTNVQMGSECAHDPQKQDAWFVWLFRQGMLIILASCVILFFSPLFYPFKSRELGLYTASLFLLPLLENVNRFILSNARSKLKNQVYARINLFSSLIHWFFLLPLSYLFSFRGAIYSSYAVQMSIMLFGLYQSRRFLPRRATTACLSSTAKRVALKLSFSSGLSNIINNSLGLVDVFFLGFVIQDMSVIASYKVAANIPNALAFIPSAIDTVLLPRFARMQGDARRLRSSYGKVIAAVCGVNLLVCIGAFLFGGSVMTLLYGAQYEDATVCFFILIVGYFFSCVRSVSYSVLYSQRKVGVNLAVVAISAILTVSLNMLLIPRYGSVGAACASAVTNFFAAAVMLGYLLHFFVSRIRDMENERA